MAQSAKKAVVAAPLLDADILLRAAFEVWGLYFQSECPPATKPTELPRGSSCLTACVSLKGDWNGGVLIICATEIVMEAAQALFGEQDDDVALANAKDLLGEITNTIAGSVTESLPGMISLSLPVIAHGVDLSVGVPDGETIAEVGLVYKSKPVHLKLLEAIQSNS